MTDIAYQREWRRLHPERFAQLMRKYKKGEDYKKWMREYKQKTAAKRKVQRRTYYLIQKGFLVRPTICQGCGGLETKASDGRSLLQAHHEDYSYPERVVWLCSKCHSRKHEGEKAGELSGPEGNSRA